jgi:hypothetical protein
MGGAGPKPAGHSGVRGLGHGYYRHPKRGRRKKGDGPIGFGSEIQPKSLYSVVAALRAFEQLLGCRRQRRRMVLRAIIRSRPRRTAGHGCRPWAAPGWRATQGRQALDVDAAPIRIVTCTSAQLSIYRPEAGGVLAWELRSEGMSARTSPGRSLFPRSALGVTLPKHGRPALSHSIDMRTSADMPAIHGRYLLCRAT